MDEIDLIADNPHMNVLLDLDGTLTDSRPGIIARIKHALAVLQQPSPIDASLHRFIGPPLRDTFSELLAVHGDDRTVDLAIAAYRERFTTLGMFENTVYERIPHALDELAASGARLYLATSKPRVFAERILEYFGLAARFVAVYGSELDGARADKSELIAHALSMSKLAAGETLMVGDRCHDVHGAVRNGVFPAGVLWGYGSQEELELAGAKRLLSHPSELGQLLHTHR
jgi:phosphoglycolate phosphatase